MAFALTLLAFSILGFIYGYPLFETKLGLPVSFPIVASVGFVILAVIITPLYWNSVVLRPSKSFHRLLDIYPSSYTESEHAQTFLWYHLRKYPNQRTASLKEIQQYFLRADKPKPTTATLRAAFTGKVNESMFPPGNKPDTFGISNRATGWWDDNFGSVFESDSTAKPVASKLTLFSQNHPVWFWLGVFGSFASIISIPLAFLFRWYDSL